MKRNMLIGLIVVLAVLLADLVACILRMEVPVSEPEFLSNISSNTMLENG